MSRRWRAGRVFVLTGWLVFVAGCAWIPPQERTVEYMEPPEMAETLAEVRERLAQWPEDRWWDQFGSPELNTIVEAARKDNPGLKAATARMREADALVRVEGARLLPFLDADASLTHERVSQRGVFNALSDGRVSGARVLLGIINPLSFRYEFDFWGKNRAAMEAAMGQAAAEQAEQAEAHLRLTTAVVRTFVRTVALQQQVELADRMVELRRRLRELTDMRFRFGLESESAVQSAVADLESAKKRAAAVRDQFDLQRHLLARLSGRGPDAVRDLLTRDVAVPRAIPAPQQLPLGLLTHRPDLASALYRAEAAAKRVKVAVTQFYPSVDLTGFVGFNAVTPIAKGADHLANLLFSGQAFSYGIAPGLRLPWFEGGRLRGELAARRAEYEGAVELYNETLLGALQEVADSLSSWEATGRALEAHRRLFRAVSRDWRLTKIRLTGGLDDDRHLLRQHLPVLEQEYALKALESDHVVTMVDLIEALGGGYDNQEGRKTK